MVARSTFYTLPTANSAEPRGKERVERRATYSLLSTIYPLGGQPPTDRAGYPAGASPCLETIQAASLSERRHP